MNHNLPSSTDSHDGSYGLVHLSSTILQSMNRAFSTLLSKPLNTVFDEGFI
jgi:hypothetical protein